MKFIKYITESGEVRVDWFEKNKQVLFNWQNHSIRQNSNGTVLFFINGKTTQKEVFLKNSQGKNVNRARMFAQELVDKFFKGVDGEQPVWISGKNGNRGYK